MFVVIAEICYSHKETKRLGQDVVHQIAIYGHVEVAVVGTTISRTLLLTKEPIAEQRIIPNYPELARRLRKQRTALLKIFVGRMGTVESDKVCI